MNSKGMRHVAVIAGIVAAVLLSAALLYDHFVTDNVMDKGGMENPDYTENIDDIEILDGDGTYVDNQALLDIIVGTWKSGDDRMNITVGDDSSIIMELDGTARLESFLDFSYVLPADHQSVDFSLNEYVLRSSDGTEQGEIINIYCDTDGSDGIIFVEFALKDSESEIFQLTRSDLD